MKKRKFSLIIAICMVFVSLFVGCSSKENTANKAANVTDAAKTNSSNAADTPDTTAAKEQLKNDPKVQDFKISISSDRVTAEITFKNDADTAGINQFTFKYGNTLRKAYKRNTAEMTIKQNEKTLASVVVE